MKQGTWDVESESGRHAWGFATWESGDVESSGLPDDRLIDAQTRMPIAA